MRFPLRQIVIRPPAHMSHWNTLTNYLFHGFALWEGIRSLACWRACVLSVICQKKNSGERRFGEFTNKGSIFAPKLQAIDIVLFIIELVFCLSVSPASKSGDNEVGSHMSPVILNDLFKPFA